jgi:HSP20 family protein
MANLAVRDPFQMNNTFRQLIDRFFDDSITRTANPFVEEGTLPVDISERDGKVWVRASMPGFKQEEIDVQVHEGVLSITARKSGEHEESGDRWFRRERYYGSLSRRIALPGIVDKTEVDATLEDGVLTLSMALPEAARPKQIQINAPKNRHN